MDRELLATLVASASTSTSADPGPLARVAGRCWPRPADGSVPAALDWVRRWGPGPLAGPVAACACGTGRCGTCN